MSDIVERIRNRINDAPMPTEHLLDEAADEIERLYTLAKANNDLARRHADTITALRAEVERMREALAFYADEDRWDDFRSDERASAFERNFGSDFGSDAGEIARVALTQTKDTTDDA